MPMLSQNKFDLVMSFLSRGESNRRTASIVGVDRTTVNKIASGEHCLFRRKFSRRKKFENRGPTKKCPGCGAEVRMPCLKCELEEGEKRNVFLGDDWSGRDLAMDLSCEDRGRYEEVAERKKNEEPQEEFEETEADQEDVSSPRIDSEGWFVWETM